MIPTTTYFVIPRVILVYDASPVLPDSFSETSTVPLSFVQTHGVVLQILVFLYSDSYTPELTNRTIPLLVRPIDYTDVSHF